MLAIDADTNPNLASVLGIPRNQAEEIVTLPRNLMERRTMEDGSVKQFFTGDPEALVGEFGIKGPDDVRLMVMGKVGHAGSGCLCSAHASEAGLEHLSRGTGRHVSRIVAVLEPYYRSMETARNVVSLANDLGVADVVVLANKVRDNQDSDAIGEFCDKHNMHLIGTVPFDLALANVERRGGAPIDARAVV